MDQESFVADVGDFTHSLPAPQERGVYKVAGF
jgi:hypothetical protein